MTKQFTGIAASSGIAIAKGFRLQNPDLTIETKYIENVTEELKKLDDALKKSIGELEAIREKTKENIDEEHAEVFSAHLLILNDPELLNPIREKIEIEKKSAAFALKEVTDQFVTIFESMDNEYMRERAADIRDVSKRVLAHLLGKKMASLAEINEEVVLIAEDLTPSDTAQLNRKFVRAFVTDIGGRTSHSAIMARSLEIPAVVGTKSITEIEDPSVTIIVDAFEGKVLVDPTEEEIAHYKEKQAEYEAQKEEWKKLVHEKTETKDGHTVELVANIGTPNDLEGVKSNGAEGIGLYRTEFLYMDRNDLPTEEEQFEAYKKVLEEMEGKPVVIRTLDIGGDKELPYLDLPKEMNPFLGLRAIRFCLERPDIFRVQLRALLRASVYGNLKIMFPMVATLDEFRQAKAILEEEKDKLLAAGEKVSDSIEVGIMVEIPSTAVMADQFAKEVDFFSIGTNDLIQYTLAADRMNESVSYLYQPYNPAILRLVKMVIDASHKEGKWTGMCGEMAGDAIAIPLLLGLGLDEFSMSATSILLARSQLRSLSKKEMEDLAAKALDLNTAEEVKQLVEEILSVK